MEPKLPVDEQLEKDILGCCFAYDPSAMATVRSVLTPEDFSVMTHQQIFRSICRLSDSGGALDRTAVHADMNARTEPVTLGFLFDCEERGGLVILEKLLDRAKDLARRRMLMHRACQLAHDAGDLTIRLDDVASRAQASIREIYGTADQGGPEDIAAIIEQAGGIGEFLKPTRGILSPWPMVDHVTGGWQNGDLVLIGARPSMGKTALALEAVRHAAERGTPSVFYSYEMTREAVVMRLISRRTGIPFLDIRQGELNTSERRMVREAVEALGALPLRIVGASGKTVLAIRVHAERLYHQGKCGLIAVDYIGLIRGMDQRQLSRNHELGQICAQLKEIAGTLNVPMLVLSQLSRAPEGRNDKRPIMSDLRDSGDLESHADLIAFLHRPGYYNREDPSLRLVAELIISKQRNGDTPIIPLEFYRECGRFDPARQPEAA